MTIITIISHTSPWRPYTLSPPLTDIASKLINTPRLARRWLSTYRWWSRTLSALCAVPAPIAFLIAYFPSLVRAIHRRRLYHRSFVAFAVVLGVGHTDSLALNKHWVVRSPEHVTLIISTIAGIPGAILVILLYVFGNPLSERSKGYTGILSDSWHSTATKRKRHC